MTPEQLKRHALALGAELEIDGKTMNASRQQLRVVPAKPAPAVAPAPPPPDPMASTKAMIEAQAIAAVAQNESIANLMTALLAEMSKPREGGAPRPIAFDLERDKNTNLLKRIVPVYRLGALN